MSKNLTLTHQEDEAFKKLAESLPPMQIVVGGIPQTIGGKPLYVDHHAEILCHYLQKKKKGVKAYVKAVMKKQAEQSIKLTIVK